MQQKQKLVLLIYLCLCVACFRLLLTQQSTHVTTKKTLYMQNYYNLSHPEHAEAQKLMKRILDAATSQLYVQSYRKCQNSKHLCQYTVGKLQFLLLNIWHAAIDQRVEATEKINCGTGYLSRNDQRQIAMASSSIYPFKYTSCQRIPMIIPKANQTQRSKN